jgi:hypothetical protein
VTAAGHVAPSRSCGFCGRLAPVQRHVGIEAALVPACSKCFCKPIGPCTACGRTGALYGTRQRVPLVCGFCWNSHAGSCTSCGAETTLVPTGEGTPSLCGACYRPGLRRCGSCLQTGRTIKVIARDGEPDLCGYCWRGPRATCVVCGRDRRCPTGARAGTPACAACVPRRHQPCGACGRHDMPFAATRGTVICWPCYKRCREGTPAPALPAYDGPVLRAGDLRRPRGWKRQEGCLDCTKTSPRYTYGRCDRCALIAVFNHFTPDPEARRALAPLKDALVNGSAVSSLRWLMKNPQLLIGMGTGTIRINHAALDALPRSRTTEIIRSQLVATGCLPHRNSYAADFQNWLNAYLADVEPAANRIVLHEYGTWRLLQRIHRPRDGRPQTYSTLQYAKTRIRSAHRFLAWLGQRNTWLAAATQADVDEFLSLHAQLAGTLQPFLRWATQTRNSRRLGCRPERRDQPKPAITADKRWQLLRRLLHDDSLDSADRVMGAIILTYAASLTKVLSIQMDDVDVIGNHDTGIEVSLALGPAEVRLPPVLDQLLVQHMRRNRLPANGSAIGTSMWLFPGTKAGQPLSHARAVVRLRQLGLHPGPGRSRALLHLASRVEAPLLAQALGIHPSTAVRWSELAGRPFGGYVARQTRGPTAPQHRR